MHNEEMLDRAALYALGDLDPVECLEFERHLEEGCRQCQAAVDEFRATAAIVAFEIEPVAPPPSLRNRVLAGVQPKPAHLHIVRDFEGQWKPTGIPGIDAKVLFYDREQSTVTTLVRMAPGAMLPRHRHSKNEQCLVVEGDIGSAGITLHAGDYQCALSGSVHDPIRTENGCLLLIMSAPHDEFLA